MLNGNPKYKKMCIGCGVALISIAAVITAVLLGGNEKAQISSKSDVQSQSVVINGIDGKDDSSPTIKAPENTGQTTQTNSVLDPDKEGQSESNLSETESSNKKPPAPPKVENEKDLTNPNQKPSYHEEDKKVEPDSGKPKNGDKKDGKIYVEGFGWIEDKGGKSVGEEMGQQGDELTGNKVGSMD